MMHLGAVSDPPWQLTDLHTDHLGSVRFETGWLGNSTGQHDYFPFGDEIAPQFSFNTHQYTGHERDANTGLDYMLARYYSSSLSRFLSTDPAESSARERNPQSWNRYTYVLNNPLVLVDPDGANARWATGPNQPTRQEKSRIVEGLAQAARNPDVKARLQNMETSSVDFQVGTKSLPSGTYGETQPAPGSTVGNTKSAEMNVDFKNADADRGQPGAPASDVELLAHEVDHGSNMSTPQGRAVIATQPTQEESAADALGKKADSDPATQAPATRKEKKEIKQMLKK